MKAYPLRPLPLLNGTVRLELQGKALGLAGKCHAVKKCRSSALSTHYRLLTIRFGREVRHGG